MYVKSLIIVILSLAFVNCQINADRRKVEEKVVSEASRSEACNFDEYKPIYIVNYVDQYVSERVKPEYPKEAEGRQTESEVFVRILVSPEGEVVDSCLFKGDPVFEAVSNRAARRWKFRGTGSRSFVKAVLLFRFRISSKTDEQEETHKVSEARP